MGSLVLWIDRLLRRKLNVFEFSDDPDCILRLQVTTARHTLQLANGKVEKGEPVLGLHLWNERIHPIPPGGADLAWGTWLRRSFERSLHLVGHQMRQDPSLAGVRAVGAATGALVPGETSSGLRVMQHWGFTVGPPPRRRFGWFVGFWENFFSWWLIWAYNRGSLAYHRFSGMGRTEMWMLSADFLKRYGGSQPAGRAERLAGSPDKRGHSGE